eukprot:TRINITY_DN31972_c0_g1_i1.p1 TRINITY_DN31972_c0_g1~~TRINITY_DN31972_c0_g1_i1.p1  ORF type:complete len:196 (+),score=51.78 TRINITY_DN31972_c0_g1_i1:129-716(+)
MEAKNLDLYDIFASSSDSESDEPSAKVPKIQDEPAFAAIQEAALLKDLKALSEEQQKFVVDAVLQDEVLSDISSKFANLSEYEVEKLISVENGEASTVYIKRQTGDAFPVIITPLSTLRQLKADIADIIGARENQRLGSRRISWKHVWKNYCLVFGHSRLLDDNLLLVRDYQIPRDAELAFARHRKLNGRRSAGT